MKLSALKLPCFLFVCFFCHKTPMPEVVTLASSIWSKVNLETTILKSAQRPIAYCYSITSELKLFGNTKIIFMSPRVSRNSQNLTLSII